jgi:hypothetical protein
MEAPSVMGSKFKANVDHPVFWVPHLTSTCCSGLNQSLGGCHPSWRIHAEPAARPLSCPGWECDGWRAGSSKTARNGIPFQHLVSCSIFLGMFSLSLWLTSIFDVLEILKTVGIIQRPQEQTSRVWSNLYNLSGMSWFKWHTWTHVSVPCCCKNTIYTLW